MYTTTAEGEYSKPEKQMQMVSCRRSAFSDLETPQEPNHLQAQQSCTRIIWLGILVKRTKCPFCCTQREA
jgi:hypothetical protein